MQMADIYNVRNDSWTRIETHIGRGVPASILLPNGKVLLVSGETPWVNQNDYVDTYGPSDARIPQILDPETHEVSFEMTGNSSDVYRGYHNMAESLEFRNLLPYSKKNKNTIYNLTEPVLRNRSEIAASQIENTRIFDF